MAKGQAERLMPMIESVMRDGGMKLEELDAIAVGVGPGNFTGIRIGVAAARGLALALGIPAIGVTSFEIMRAANGATKSERQLVSLEGPRGSYLLQLFENGAAAGPPKSVAGSDISDLGSWEITDTTETLGYNAALLSETHAPKGNADTATSRECELPTTDLARVIGQIAAEKRATGGPIQRPAPLYVRAADAAPAKDKGPTILPC